MQVAALGMGLLIKTVKSVCGSFDTSQSGYDLKVQL